ncbi:MAG: ABC transporter permease [Actinomycetota bacterium]
MFFFIIRRLLVSVPILLAASFVMFGMVTISGDPLAEFRQSTDPNAPQTMATMRQILELDKPFTERYVDWLTGLFSGDFGLNRDGQEVSALLSNAIGTTLRLIILATIASILLGLFIGIISAVRQYSLLDYSSTFTAFLFFSLPVFWVAVLLKEFGAIRFNDYLEQPGLSVTGIAIITALTAGIAGALAGGAARRRATAAAGVGGVALILLIAIDATDWLTNPGISLPVIAVLSLGASVVATIIYAPLSHRPVLVSAAVAAIAGIVGTIVFDSWVDEGGFGRLFVLLVLSLALGAAVGAALGGEIDRRAAIQAGMTTTFFVGTIVVIDKFISAWSPGRTIGTVNPKPPNLDEPFWETMVVYAGHQILPSIALALIGFATYMRFTRASMLETLNSDYVRTAKAKGLPATQVILRHAFRTALIPVMTVITISFATAIEGAVITERVFAWNGGMGTLFIEGLNEVDPYPVMGFLVVVSVSIVLLNAVADIMYAYLDPRIRQ